MRKIYTFAILLIIFTSITTAAFPEMTPTSVNFQDVEPGDNIEQRIWLGDNNLEQNTTVDMEPDVSETVGESLFSDSYSNHDDISEQRISSWWSFEIEPLRSENEFSPEGTDDTYQGYVDITLSVPDDAEPGLRYGRLSLDPEAEVDDGVEDGGQLGFAFSPNLPYSVYVQGNPQRSLQVQDVRGFRTNEDMASVEVLLTNTGTVTTSSDNFHIDLIDSRGEKLNELRVSGIKLEPGESDWTNTRWTGENVAEGNYEVDGQVDYMTGNTYVSGSFSLSDVVEVVPEDSPEVEEEESERLPTWLVLMVLVVLGVLMWSFEIDPVWIFGIVGVLGISAFVLMSNVSNLLLVGVLIPALLIVYLGV